MARFIVTLADQTTEAIDSADAYQQEGPLTTFFSLRDERQVIDSWSVRLASFRTADISAIRRVLDDDRRHLSARPATSTEPAAVAATTLLRSA